MDSLEEIPLAPALTPLQALRARRERRAQAVSRLRHFDTPLSDDDEVDAGVAMFNVPLTTFARKMPSQLLPLLSSHCSDSNTSWEEDLMELGLDKETRELTKMFSASPVLAHACETRTRTESLLRMLHRNDLQTLMLGTLLPLPVSGSRPTSSGSVESLARMKYILATRPDNLPPKPRHEAAKHDREHEQMVSHAVRREQQQHAALAKRNRRLQQSRDGSTGAWTGSILPDMPRSLQDPGNRDLWWQGIPDTVRGVAWTKAIGDRIGWAAGALRVVKEHAGPDPGAVVLAAYAANVQHAPPLALALLVAVLLQHVPDPAKALVCLGNLLQRPLVRACVAGDEALMAPHGAAFEQHLRSTNHRLATHFAVVGVTAADVLGATVPGLLTHLVPLDTGARILDVVACEGDRALEQCVLALLSAIDYKLYGLRAEIVAVLLAAHPLDVGHDNDFLASARAVLRE